MSRWQGTTPALSVVIPAFNAASTIETALASALAQTVEEVEVLVVDDGSRDATAEIVRTWRERDTRIRLLTHPDGLNHGVAASRNHAVNAAKGSVVGFLDADDEWLPHAVERFLKTAEAHPDAAVIYGQAHEVAPAGSRIIGRGAPGATFDLFSQLARFNVIVTSATAARRHTLPPQPFPEGLPFQFEDWACWLRLARTRRFAYIPEPLARYHVRESSATGLVACQNLELDVVTAEGMWLRQLLCNAAPSEQHAITSGLRFRAGEAIRFGARALRRGHLGRSLRWLRGALLIARTPRDLGAAFLEASRGHRRAVHGVDPDLVIRPGP